MDIPANYWFDKTKRKNPLFQNGNLIYQIDQVGKVRQRVTINCKNINAEGPLRMKENTASGVEGDCDFQCGENKEANKNTWYPDWDNCICAEKIDDVNASQRMPPQRGRGTATIPLNRKPPK